MVIAVGSRGSLSYEYVAQQRDVAGLILAAPWTSIVAASEYQDPKHSYRLAPGAAPLFDEVAMVGQIRAPLLVFQGTKDDAIPPAEGPALERAAASRDKRFVPITGAKHDWLLENRNRNARSKRFLRPADAFAL